MEFQNLPNELLLKVLSYSDPKEIISSGLVSKRLRTISQDYSLWQSVDLSKKIVKTELLDLILSRNCKSLNLSNSTIFGHLSIFDQNTHLRELDLSGTVSKVLMIHDNLLTQ